MKLGLLSSVLYLWVSICFCSFFHLTLSWFLIRRSYWFSINNFDNFCFWRRFDIVRLWYLAVILLIKSHDWSFFPFVIFWLYLRFICDGLLVKFISVLELTISGHVEVKFWLWIKSLSWTFFFEIRILNSRRIKDSHCFHIHRTDTS